MLCLNLQHQLATPANSSSVYLIREFLQLFIGGLGAGNYRRVYYTRRTLGYLLPGFWTVRVDEFLVWASLL